MVVNPLWIGGSLGALLSGGFVYWQIGRFAVPQVPRTLFDERKELIAYTVGLFAGIVLSIPFGLFLTSLIGGPLLWAVVGLAGLVGGLEVGQRLLLNSVYFGHGEAGPFYAVGFRAGASAFLVLTLVSLYLGTASFDPVGLAGMLVESGAIVALTVAGSLMSIGVRTPAGTRSGGPLSSGLVSAVGFFFMGFAGLYGPLAGLVASAIVLGVAGRSFLRLRDPILATIPPPGGPAVPEGEPRPAFGRTDR